MSIPSMGATHGNPPYRESSLKAALRLALSQAGTTFGAGLGAVPRGANFGTAFLASAGGASRAYTAAQQAAQEYALKQQQAQENSDFRDYQKQNIASEITARADEASHRAKEDAKLGADRQKFNDLIDPAGPFKMDPVEARQIVYGLTSGETTAQKKASTPTETSGFKTFVDEAKYKKEHPELFPTDSADTSWIPPLVTTMRNGQKFLNTAQLQGKEKGTAIRWASTNGVLPLGEADSDALNNIENSRGNMDDIEKQIASLLPKDATGRVLAYPGNRLSRFFQTNEQRAAFGSFRAAAIQSLRSMAGSKGLRINQAEIKAAMQNDIPQINDTYRTALQRLKNVRGMLDRAEHPIISRNWGASGGATPTDADNAYLKKLGL